MNTLSSAAHNLMAGSRSAQGLPERITDPATLARVADILTGAGREAAPGHHSGADLITTTTADPTCRKGDAREHST